MKRIFKCMTATMFVFSLTMLTTTAHAGIIPPYKWTFSLPSDAPYNNCTITFYADGYAISSEKRTVNKGSSTSWSSPKPLSMIFGYCHGAYFLLGQYCDGVNVSNGNTASHACKYDVSVKFCPKVPNPDPYSSAQYGFCPN